MMAWVKPYEGLQDDEIEQKYVFEEFPTLGKVPANSVIEKRWNETYKSVDEVVQARL
jgi:hypothetical protein